MYYLIHIYICFVYKDYKEDYVFKFIFSIIATLFSDPRDRKKKSWDPPGG